MSFLPPQSIEAWWSSVKRYKDEGEALKWQYERDDEKIVGGNGSLCSSPLKCKSMGQKHFRLDEKEEFEEEVLHHGNQETSYLGKEEDYYI